MGGKVGIWSKYFLYLLLLVGILILLYLHFRLSITRYFDADEFAHLHWGYAFSIGEKPYSDFFYLFPPFFLYPIAFIMKVFGRTFESLIFARIFIFISYLSILGILGLIVKKMRGTLAALFAVFIFVFLPMPQDKMIEIRPDLVAVFFGLLGMYLFIISEENIQHLTYDRNVKKLLNVICLPAQAGYMFSGLSYGLSLAFVPKTVFFLIPIGIIWVYRIIRGIWANTEPDLIKHILSFGTGLFIPALLILGFGGFNPALYATLFIFLTASIVGVLRGVASLSHKENSRCVSEFLIFGSFYAALYAFVKIFPLKHAQYWIPLIPFFCFYVGDLFNSILNIRHAELVSASALSQTLKQVQGDGKKRLSFVSPGGIFLSLILIGYLTFLGGTVYQSKMKWTNQDTKAKIGYFLAKIPENEPVFDLTGETVFFRDGYYFCCVPYGQYEEGIGFDIPDIKSEFEKNNTEYVHVGYEGRTGVLLPDQEKYIKENFKSLDTNPFLWQRKITL